MELLIGMQMLDFELVDCLAAECSEENGQKTDDEPPEIVEEGVAEENRRGRSAVGGMARKLPDGNDNMRRTWREDGGFVVTGEGRIDQSIRGDVRDGIEFLSRETMGINCGH